MLRSASATAALLTLAACAQLTSGSANVPAGSAAATPAPAAKPVAAVAPGATPAPAGAPAPKPAAGSAGTATASATPGVTNAARPPGTAASGAAPAAPPVPGALPPFDTVAKDFKKTDALFPVWRKDDRVLLELKAEDLNKPYFFSPKLSRGIGEKRFFGGLMMGPWGFYSGAQVVEFRRVHNQLRMLALNTEFAAKADTPEGRAVAGAFSNSLLASAPVLSAPHAERKTFLVDASALFMSDITGLSMSVQRAYRQGYSMDPRNSGIDNVRGDADALILDITQHFYTASISVPTPPPPGVVIPPGTPVPSTPESVPDARSFFLGLNLSLSKLPEKPMAPRRADARVGYFVSSVDDFSTDLQRTPRQRYVNRWRLEKKDPSAALSEPVKPITFRLDKNIPTAYRPAITAGILEWNKAFAKIGFKDAIVAKQQPDDATWDTLDPGVASIRWMTNSDISFGAIGPSHVDPRTGEILDADIGFESLSSRSLRALRSQVLSAPSAVGSSPFTMDWAGLLQARDAEREGALPSSGLQMTHQHSALCQHADYAAEQLAYAMDVLEAQGELDPDSADVRQFVLDYLMDTTMHEVGHTLGLRHNFRSSRVYSERQLSDESFTRETGLAGSVMEYAPINLPRPGEKGGTRWQVTLGPYDYWAIEYAYKPIDPKDETLELQRIASRSAEPGLAYGTDEDNFIGIDPETLHFDLGDDPVAFAKKRFEIGRDLVARQSQRSLKQDADYSVVRRSVTYAVRDMGRAAGILTRQIGGLRTLRDFPGSGRDPLQPVPAAVQREALDALARGVLAADSLQVGHELRRKLAPNYFERLESLGSVTTDISVDDLISQLRKAVLAQLMTDGVATRILENERKLPEGEAFRLSELYSRLSREIWSDLDGKVDIPGARRELQRDHVNRLAAQMLRPAATRTDARSLLRIEAQTLSRRLATAARRSGLSAEAKAHLEDSRETLDLALGAKLQRIGL